MCFGIGRRCCQTAELGGAGPSGLIRAQEDAQTGMDIVCRELVEQSGKITYSKGAWEPCPRKLEPENGWNPAGFQAAKDGRKTSGERGRATAFSCCNRDWWACELDGSLNSFSLRFISSAAKQKSHRSVHCNVKTHYKKCAFAHARCFCY